MLILLLPITTILVAILGFYVWHRQLTRKRHFEVADAALSTFSRAQAALTYARHSASFVYEGKSRKRDQVELPADSEQLDALVVRVERLRRHSEAFDELERAAFAVEVHFGDAIAHQVRAPLRAYNRIVMATTCRMGSPGMFEVAYDRRRRRPKAVDHSGSGVSDFGRGGDTVADQVAIQLESAKADVENALRPYLVTPTFEEFLRMRRLLVLARRRFARLLASGGRRRRSSRDMIPVYGQSPLGDGLRLPEPQ